MPFHNFKLPVVDNTHHPKEILYRDFTCSPPADALDDGGLWYAFLMAYLCDVWKAVRHRENSPDPEVIFATGQGNVSVVNRPAGSTIRRVEVVATRIPDSADMIFSTPPSVYLGKCGWTADQPGATFRIGNEFTFSLTAEVGNELRGPIMWINNVRNYFETGVTDYNGFWWDLKPGVECIIRILGDYPGDGVTIDNTSVFNPNLYDDGP